MAGGGSYGGGYGGGGGDGGGFADAFGAVGGAGFGFFYEGGDGHVGHVEGGGDHVVGEGGVAHQAVVQHDLLHQGQAQPLGDAALDLAHGLGGVEDAAHVLGGGDVSHSHQAQVGVHVHGGPVGGAGERHVGVALAVLVQRLGGGVVVLHAGGRVSEGLRCQRQLVVLKHGDVAKSLFRDGAEARARVSSRPFRC